MSAEQPNFKNLSNEELDALDKAKRPERAETLVNFLEKIKAYDFCHDLNSGEGNKENISFDQFKSFLLRLNGIARGVAKKERRFDGENVAITGGLGGGDVVLPPAHQDKEMLLQQAFEAAKDLDGEDASYLLPAVINSVHLFVDGNGRTSRIMHLLLGAETKEAFDAELKKALGVEGRLDTEDINTGLIDYEIEEEVTRKHGYDFSASDPNSLGKLKGGIASAEYDQLDSQDESIKKNFKQLEKINNSNDVYYILTAIAEALPDEKFGSVLRDNGMISPLKMQNLSAEEWEKIFNNYYGLKREHVMTLIDIFKHPEEHLNTDDEDEPETLKDFFIGEIKAAAPKQ